MYTTAMIHGRFQPFHIGHFKYLKAALDISETLIVGITNPDPTSIRAVASDSHRHSLSENPFPFYIRLLMVRQSILKDSEISHRIKDIIIIPFPVNNPKLWEYYIPMKDVIQIMRILDPWDTEKKEMFSQAGFEVFCLDGPRMMSGTEVRNDIKENNTAWKTKVPEGTRDILIQLMKSNTEENEKEKDTR